MIYFNLIINVHFIINSYFFQILDQIYLGLKLGLISSSSSDHFKLKLSWAWIIISSNFLEFISLRVELAWVSFWVHAYFATSNWRIYFCLVLMLGLFLFIQLGKSSCKQEFFCQGYRFLSIQFNMTFFYFYLLELSLYLFQFVLFIYLSFL